MRAFIIPIAVMLLLVSALALSGPGGEGSALNSVLTILALFATMILCAALAASLSTKSRILTSLAVGIVGLPISGAMWIMIIWPVWRLGFAWDIYLKTLPTLLFWYIPVMTLTGFVTKLIIERKSKYPTKRLT